MTQAERRGNGQKNSTQLGTLSVIALVVILFLARNYGFSTAELNADPTAQLAPQATVQLSVDDSVVATAEKAEVEITPVKIDPEEKPVVENSASQKSELPPLASAGPEPEKKKATRTPKPRATLTPTRVKKPTATSTPTVRRATATETSTPKLSRSQSGLPLIYYDDLPREAQQTIRLIDKGGPFPYSRDGIEFQNRERILPRKARGYYSEYTVITPGSNDRGARRVIAGENGELYYTDDHYDSFKEVAR